MKNIKILVLSICALVFIVSCNNDDDESNSECDFNTIVDLELYEEPSPSTYTIVDAEINGSCLEITIGASGCDGQNWNVNLVSDYPISVMDFASSNISLKLTNPEICLAYFTNTYSFDISELTEGLSRFSFMLEGWDSTLEYLN